MKRNHIKSGALAIIVVFLLSIILPTGQAIAHDSHYGDEYIDIIVRYEEAVPEEDTLDSRFKNIQTMDVLPVQAMSVPASAIKELSLEENVRRITYDQEVETSQSTYAVSDEDWNQEMIGTFDAWDEGYTGENVSVAVLDTGFFQHSDITYAGGHSIFDDSYELGPDVWTNDHSGHGTHVAGILGAQKGTRAQGVAPGIDLFGVKVYHQENGDRTRVSNLLSGLNWAINNGSDIIVISSGYPNHDQEIYEMIQEADRQGILVIAASGNMTDENGTIDYPAAHSEVIAVSGVNNRQARVSDSMIAWENELAAPGQNILSLSTDGSHKTMSGTSQATPHVAGIAALLMQKYPSERPNAIRQRMQELALDLGEPGQDPLYGYGLVQFKEQTEEEPAPEEDPDDAEDSQAEPSEDTETEEETDTSEENNVPTEEAGSGETNNEDTEAEGEGDSPEDNTPDDDENDTENSDDDSDEENATEAPSDAEDNEENIEEDEDALQHSAVWIRPSETNGVATVAEEDIDAVSTNGVLAISFDSTLGHIDRISLTREQISRLKEKNVTLLIARVDLEWVIPASNLSEGNAFITFEESRQSIKHEELTKGNILTFGIEQEGERLDSFPSEMTYRFFTPEVEFNQDHLYQWNETTEAWELLGDAYTKGGVVGVTTEVPTLAVFNPEELAAAVTLSAAEETADDAETPDDTAQTDSEMDAVEDTASLEEDSSGIPVILSSVVVVLLSVTGGFYFLGGKSKD